MYKYRYIQYSCNYLHLLTWNGIFMHAKQLHAFVLVCTCSNPTWWCKHRCILLCACIFGCTFINHLSIPILRRGKWCSAKQNIICKIYLPSIIICNSLCWSVFLALICPCWPLSSRTKFLQSEVFNHLMAKYSVCKIGCIFLSKGLLAEGNP